MTKQTHRRPKTTGPRLMALLLGIAAMPALFVGWIVATEYDAVVSTRQLAEEAQEQAMGIAMLDELRLALVDEQAWITVGLGADSLGLPIETLDAVFDIDINGARFGAQQRSDGLTAMGVGRSFAGELAAIREIDDVDVINARYDAVIEQVGELSADMRVVLEDRAADIPKGTEVIQASRIAAAATTAEFEHNQQLWAYLQSQFAALLDAPPSYVSLVTHQTALHDALDHLDRKLGDDSPVRAALTNIQQSAQVALFEGMVSESIDALFDPAVVEPAEAPTAIEQVLEMPEFLAAGTEAAQMYNAMKLATFGEQAIAGADLVDTSERQFRTTILVVIVLGSASVVIAFALARYIGRPMVQLATVADELGTGASIEAVDRGPREVRQVGLALAAAARNLVRMELLEHEATHDELTGAPTRRYVREHLARSLTQTRRNESLGGVMFVDIDEFKVINDTYGHAAGDEVLQAVAERIASPLREADLVGRYGGDEFIVVANSIGSADVIHRLAERVVDSVDAMIDLSHVSNHPHASAVPVSVSVGVTVFTSADDSIEGVLRRADEATYAAKATGRNRAVPWENGAARGVTGSDRSLQPSR